MDYAIGLTVVILKVAVGLGFVIFVHELGHFAVAKLCGVKCEKFYLGFDIAGLKFCKFRWGETEYGIGILPLGGYVKMLGQEDNPAKIKEEMERARETAEDGGRKAEGGGWKAEGNKGRETGNDQPSVPPSALRLPPSLYDPRSFLAQSVPKRMAIISAGVIMNVIFAFLMAVVAFRMGVMETPCVVGQTFPGEPAWKADLHAGDVILEIAGKKMTQFRDLQTAISLGNIDPKKGVEMLVHRPGVKEPFSITVKPDNSLGAFFIGVAADKTTRLIENRKTWLVQKRECIIPGSAASQAEPAFHNGDQFVRIDDTPIDSYAQIDAELARKANKKITVIVERAATDAQGKPTDARHRVPITVAPGPMRTLGLVMQMGRITAVQANSPAAAEDIMPGDLIDKINGNPVGDPMRLPEWLRDHAGETIELAIQREAAKTPVVVRVKLRQPTGLAPSDMFDSPVAASTLGIAYQVLNRVEGVAAGSPAARAGLQPEDVIVKATLIPPDKETLQKLDLEQVEDSLEFGENQHNWPALMSALQNVLPGTKVKLAFLRNGKEQTATLKPAEAADWFNPDRGFLFEPMSFQCQAKTITDALTLGGRRTLDDVTAGYRIVGALSTNRVSLRLIGGPVSIFRMALQNADEGTARLLLFLTFLSAQLAVINFLPIPVLDGGHFVLLAYEGIRGKPADERVQIVLSYIGLILILALMVWACGLDFNLISRHVPTR